MLQCNYYLMVFLEFKMKCFLYFFCSISILFSGFSLANSSEEVVVDEFIFSIYLGQGRIENPITKLDDLNVSIFPSISYYGENFFIEGTTLGYSLYETDDVIVDVVGLLNEDGLFHHFDNYQDFSIINIIGVNPSGGLVDFEPIKRDISYLGGIGITVNNDYFDTRIGAYQDIIGVHDGNEVHLSIAKGFSTTWFNAHFEAGGVMKSRKLVEYYYQFQDEELAILRGIKNLYKPKRAINWYYKVQVDVPITPSLFVVGGVKHTLLDDRIRQSLLVEKGNYLTSFIGIRYQF